jgi:hypothetical protein
MSFTGGTGAQGGPIGQAQLSPIGEGNLFAVPGGPTYVNPYVGANACLFPSELQGVLLIILANSTVTYGLAPGVPSSTTTPTVAPATTAAIANPTGYPPLQWPIFFKRGAFPYLALTSGTAYFQWF